MGESDSEHPLQGQGLWAPQCGEQISLSSPADLVATLVLR